MVLPGRRVPASVRPVASSRFSVLEYDLRAPTRKMRAMKFRLLLALFLLWSSPLVLAAQATMRVDYYHTGNTKQELFSVDRVVIEPLPWPGDPAKAIDDTNLGNYLFETTIRPAGDCSTHAASVRSLPSGSLLPRRRLLIVRSRNPCASLLHRFQ